MHYEVVIPEEVKSQLRGLPASVRQDIGYRLFLLQEDLFGDIKKLKGKSHRYRLRAGNYRALFELEGHRITVYDVGHRKDIYE